MSARYVLDACALLAVLGKEPGAEKVLEVYHEAAFGRAWLSMNKVNLLEVYYYLYRAYGGKRADHFIMEIKRTPIVINYEITDDIFAEAGRLKATYNMSLEDSIALAEASISDGALLTADRHKFDLVEEKEDITFRWIR